MSYHHGNLRESLIDAAAEIAAADGPDGVSLREVARRIGVSHNAAYRHVADRDELMRLAGARAMTRFGELMAAAIEQAGRDGSSDDPVELAWARLAASGRSYVEFATEHTGLFRLACLFPLGTVQPDGDVEHPYAQLGRCLDALVETGAVPPERRADAEIAACSAVHGLAMLWLDGTFVGLAGRGPADHSTAGRDTAGRDTAGRDTAARDTAARDRDLAEVLRVVRYGL